MAEDRQCTDFCNRLRALSLKNGKLPSHQELISHLAFTEDDIQVGRRLGTFQELQERTKCPFCQLVAHAALPDDTPHVPNEHTDVHRPIAILLFPEEQSFRLSYPSRLGTRLAFLAADDQQSNGPDTARLISGSEVQPSKILSWLEKCEHHHSGTSCSNNVQPTGSWDFAEQATSNFRVIDLELGCVRRAPLHFRYIALSYVWGQLPMFKLLKNNHAFVTSEGSLESIRSNLPKTVNDAIDLVRNIKERYLWVDALCLIQDDAADMKLGIEQMNSIYQGSFFTIVAGSGTDANSGLPGVGPGSRHSSQLIKEMNQDLKMTVLHSIDWHLSRSMYSDRGWTLQELVLPRRTLIFINDQAYFRCQQANWSEGSCADLWTHWIDHDDTNISRIPEFDEGNLSSFWAYQKLFEDYSKRQLRYDGDALRATAGIARPLAAGMCTEMVEGLPGYYLDMALLFISTHSNLRRRPEFASFSWAGWAGEIMWPRENYIWVKDKGQKWGPSNLFKWLTHMTFIEWRVWKRSDSVEDLNVRSHSKPSRLMTLIKRFPRLFPRVTQNEFNQNLMFLTYPLSNSSGLGPDFDTKRVQEPTLDYRQAYSFNSQAEFEKITAKIKSEREVKMMRNWMAGRIGRLRRAGGSWKNPESPRSAARAWEANHYYFRSLDDKHPVDYRAQRVKQMAEKQYLSADGANEALTSIPIFPPWPVLSFRTISIHLILGDTPLKHPDLHAQPRTMDFKDSPSLHGSNPAVRIPGLPLYSPSGQLVGSIHLDNLETSGHQPGSSIECLLLSYSQMPISGSALFTLATSPSNISSGSSKAGPKNELDGGGEGQKWDLFWFLHVIWNNGIAERRGVGQVLTSSLESESSPELKAVLLG